jgi:pimeloyl-ACP methyl ester carboxylesterase
MSPWCLHCLWSAAGLLTAAPAAQAEPAPIVLSDCRPEGAAEDVRCGRLTVPEDRAAPGGRRIPLNVVVLPALGPERREPLFELAGGPGVASSGSAALYTRELREYRRHRDVVLVDQRGTGGSNALECDLEEKTPLARALREMYPPSYVRACRAQLEKKADLRVYTTSIAARDLDDVRAALGYDRIHVLGISYGTRLAQEYARRYPQRVKSLFLFGVLPPWAPVPLYHATNAQRALDLLLAECAADAACASRHPGLHAQFRELMARLRRQPAAVTRNGESAVLTGDVFAEAVRNLLYTPAGARPAAGGPRRRFR